MTSALAAGCAREAPPAALAAAVTDSSGIQVITLDRSLADVAAGKAGAANVVGTKLFAIDSLTHPVAVTFLPSGEVAVVDRNDKRVWIVDTVGTVRDSIGRRGEGPGELQLPSGVIALGEDLVVLQSRPTNTLTRYSPGIPAITAPPPIPGDWTGWFWQRPDISLEFPGQSAPEIWSRRIRSLDDSTFLVYVGAVDEDTGATARSHLLKLGRDLSYLGEFATFPSVRRERRQMDDPRLVPQSFQEVWAPRLVWGAGGGNVATGWGGGAEVEVRGADGQVHALVRWPHVPAPVTPEDKRAFIDQIIRVTVAAAPGAAEMKASLSEAELEAQIEHFMSTFQFSATRPELVALFHSAGCLWLSGFDPHDSPEGTAHEWLVLDLAAPGVPPRLVTLGLPTERVVAIERGKAATIRLDDDGFRRVTVYRVPVCGEADAS